MVPILIQKVIPGCGSCVRVVDYTRTPILPGDKGFVMLRLLAESLNEGVSKNVIVVPHNPNVPAILLTLNASILSDSENKAE